MTLAGTAIAPLTGGPDNLAPKAGTTTLVVNVASRCGLTPQYTALEALQEKYGSDRFTVLGVPCNQFAGQEPGSSDEIAEFCSATYGVTFPMTEKVDVNGPGRHPLYDTLTEATDSGGYTGDVRWNFEKFLIAPDGSVTRFSPQTLPDSAEVVQAIEAALA
jgi:glutathione peroxidase